VHTFACILRISGVASYGTMEHVPPTTPTSNNFILVNFRVNLTANCPSIVYASIAGTDVNNSQLFRSVLH